MSAVTLAHQLIKLLQQNGVHTLYGVTGDVLFPLFDALAETNTIRFIGTGTETGAAFMASYQAKLTRTLGVCVATSGPGAASLINGLADAYFDKAPVLAITGQVASHKIGTGAKQDIDQQTLLGAVTTSSQTTANANAVLPVVARAIETAVHQQTVTHVAIPEDLFQQTVGPALPQIDAKTITRSPSGLQGSLCEALSLLRSSRRPLILIGGTPYRPDAAALSALADLIGAGVVVAQQSKGVLADADPRVLGSLGEAHIPDIFAQVDCILQVGTASFEKGLVPEHIPMVQVADTVGAIDYTRAHHALMGDIPDITNRLLRDLPRAHDEEWQSKIAYERQIRQKILREQQQNRDTPIHPAHAMTVLGEKTPANAVIVCDIGGYIHWFDAYFPGKEHTVLISSQWRSMGAGLPGALGAALHTKRRVIALVGDGGLLMSLPEIGTAVKYQIPVTIIVCNNHLYELEQVRMQRQGLRTKGVDIPTPDFAALARSFGAKGRRITTSEEFSDGLSEAMETQRPTLLDVQLAKVPLPFA